MVISKGYPKSRIHRNMFNNLIAIRILLSKELNYQVDFINYKNNFLRKIINETFQRKGPQREFLTA